MIVFNKKLLKLIMLIFIGLSIFGLLCIFINTNSKIKHKVGYWCNNQGVFINELQVIQKRTRQGLFGHKVIITCNIKGELSNSVGWKPYVNKVHISERFNVSNESAIIEITPIKDNREDNSYDKEMIPFEYSFDYTLNAIAYGENKYFFVCGSKEQVLVVLFSK